MPPVDVSSEPSLREVNLKQSEIQEAKMDKVLRHFKVPKFSFNPDAKIVSIRNVPARNAPVQMDVIPSQECSLTESQLDNEANI